MIRHTALIVLILAALGATALGQADAQQQEAALRNTLNQRIDLDFTDTPLVDVMAFLREVKAVNIVVDRLRVPVDNAVTIKVRDVRLSTALELVLKPLGLDYEVRENYIYVSTKDRIQRYEVRVYDVRDLLVNFSDRISSGRNLSLADQTGDDDGGGFGDDDDDEDDDEGDYEDMMSRTHSLARLISSTVRPETWEKGQVRVLGGPSYDEDDTEDGYDF